RPGADYSLLGSDEWEVLEEICDGDLMQLELMTKLLDTERQFKKKTRRVGIFETLEKCFDTSSRSQEDAIANAHLKRELREAALNGDVAKIREKIGGNSKQLNIGETTETEENKPKNWANIKFKKKE
ncbi:MAG: DNA phosphorothioation system sulfurtransferase DndC, partial [Nostocales cyanobacterium]